MQANVSSPKTRVCYIRLKETGTKLTPELQKKKVPTLAKPLPNHNKLSGRATYWFVTKEEVQVYFEDAKKFVWLQKETQTDDNGTVHYLYLIKFVNNYGVLVLVFPDNSVECIVCYPKPNRRAKPVSQNRHAVPYQHDVLDTSQNNDDNSQMMNGLDINEDQADYNGLNLEHLQPPPRILGNGLQLPSNKPLLVNILFIVPDNESVNVVANALAEIGFVKVVSSGNNQLLYSQKLNNCHRHVLIFPYGRTNRFLLLDDFAPAATEAILLMEGNVQQEELSAVRKIHIGKIELDGRFVNTQRTFHVYTQSFNVVDLDGTLLDQSIKLILQFEHLKKLDLGGILRSTNNTTNNSKMTLFVLEWLAHSPATRLIPQNIYLCFKYEAQVNAFTDYAARSLQALDIACEPLEAVVAHGSVLVYIRCPLYTRWYVVMRKQQIFDTLAHYGLREIHECTISDVEASLQRAENEEFVDELTYLKEEMIADNIPEHEKIFKLVIKKEDVKLTSEHLAELKVSYAELEKSIRSKTNAMTQLEEDITNLQKQLAQAQESITKNLADKAQIAQLQQQNNVRQQDVDRLTKEVNQLKKDKEDLDKQVASAVIKDLTATRQIDRLTQHNNELQNRYNNLNTQFIQNVAQLRNDKVALTQQNEQLTTHNSNLQKALTNATNQMTVLQNQLNTTVIEVNALQSQLNAAMIGESERDYRILQLTNEVNDLQKNYENKMKENLRLTKANEDLQYDLKKIGSSQPQVPNLVFNIPMEFLSFDNALKPNHQVFLVKINSEQLVAKFIYPQVDPKTAAFELQKLTLLRDKKLVVVKGLAQQPGDSAVYVVTEHMKQGSLEDLLFTEKKKLEQQTMIRIAIDIAKALKYLHAQNSIHGNLKVSDVLLHRKKTRAKISDYGLANLRVKTPMNIVKVSYMSPEVLVGGLAMAKSDVYSFGAILFALITNQHLMGKTQEQQRVQQITTNVNDAQFRQLIIDCCVTDLNKRPDINACLERLMKMKKK